MMLILGMALASFVAAQAQQPGAFPSMIDIEDFSFVPRSLTVVVGDRVEWTNLDDAPHTVVGGPLDSGTLLTGSSYDFTFTEPGEFDYACGFHPAMEGKVIVVADDAAIAPVSGEEGFFGDDAQYDEPFEEGRTAEGAFNEAGTGAGSLVEPPGSERADPTLLLAGDAGIPAWAYAFMVFFGFALLAGIVFVVMLHGKHSLPEVSVMPPMGVPSALMPAVNYVRSARARGLDDAQVKASFRRQGWSDEQIEQVYRFF